MRMLKLSDDRYIVDEPIENYKNGVDPVDKYPYNVTIDNVRYESTMPVWMNLIKAVYKRVINDPWATVSSYPYCIRLTEYRDGKIHIRAFVKEVHTLKDRHTGEKLTTHCIAEINQRVQRDELLEESKALNTH